MSGAVMCPRCLSIADHSPDEKACSDNCITRHLKTIADQQAALATAQREREEAREIVAQVNNSVIGSAGYFTTPSCVDAVEDLKHHANQLQHAKDAAEARCAALINQLGGFALDLLAEADVSDATGHVCCAQTRRHDADQLAALLGAASTRKG